MWEKMTEEQIEIRKLKIQMGEIRKQWLYAEGVCGKLRNENEILMSLLPIELIYVAKEAIDNVDI